MQKPVLAEFRLASEANKLAVNDVVHPAVAADFDASGMEWLESAILFESRFDRRVCFDKVVCVVAPQDVRIQRIMKRDNISAERAAGWIAAQMPQEEMQPLLESLAKPSFEVEWFVPELGVYKKQQFYCGEHVPKIKSTSPLLYDAMSIELIPYEGSKGW